MRVGNEHSFDWKGFNFSFAIVAALAGVIFVGSSLTEPKTAASPVSPQEAVFAAAFEEPDFFFEKPLPRRVINALTVEDVVPPEGKFIAADLVNMEVRLYENGAVVASYPITKKGRPGTPWETPAGFYSVRTKEPVHFSTIGEVYMPYSMQFYGNYFIHGQTYYPDGTPTSSSFSGGCIRLSTEDAERVFDFADIGTKLFVYDAPEEKELSTLTLSSKAPRINAEAYLVADLDTGDVYMERNAQNPQPIGSITKLVTALVANETISYQRKISVHSGDLLNPPDPAEVGTERFIIGDLFYPLLMQGNDSIAQTLAEHYGEKRFVDWMNRTAASLNMTKTSYVDPSGTSPENISTPEDLFHLTAYLADKKSFVLNITHTEEKTITAEDGTQYTIQNVNVPADDEPFIGGKAGLQASADSMVSVLSVNHGEEKRRIAVIVLGSKNRVEDTTNLADWIARAAEGENSQKACAACAETDYRTIEL